MSILVYLSDWKNCCKLNITVLELVHNLFTLLKIKVLHNATEEPFLSKWFHIEPLTSEEPFCFTKGSLWQKKVLQIITR